MFNSLYMCVTIRKGSGHLRCFRGIANPGEPQRRVVTLFEHKEQLTVINRNARDREQEM